MKKIYVGLHSESRIKKTHLSIDLTTDNDSKMGRITVNIYYLFIFCDVFFGTS